jgi:hypothetical protein
MVGASEPDGAARSFSFSSQRLTLEALAQEQHDTYLANYHATGVAKVIGRTRIVEGQHKSGAIFPVRLSVSEVKVGASVRYAAVHFASLVLCSVRLRV